jgi:colanic acid/amylovoran biosynthesis glycosyltransferase
VTQLKAARPASACRELRVVMALRAGTEVGGLEASFGRITGQLRDEGITVEALVMGRDAATSATAAFLRPLMPVHTGSSVTDARRTLRGVDVLHVHGATMTIWPAHAVVAARLAGVPVVVTLHLPSHPNRVRLRGRVRVAAEIAARGFLLRFGARIVAAPSAAAAELAQRRLRAWRVQVRPLWNGVLDSGATAVATDGPLRVLLLGRLSDHKRPLDFVRAVEEAAASGTTISAAIVGDGPLRADVDRVVAASTYRDRFVVAGAAHDPSPYLRDTDLLVLTSHTEGCPLVAMEAAAAGRGVVARDDVEGLAEGWPGAFVPVGSRGASSFAEVFRTLAADRERVRRLGSVARSHFESRFSARRAAERLRGVYDEALR